MGGFAAIFQCLIAITTAHKDPIHILRRASQAAQNRHLQLDQKRVILTRRRLITILTPISTLTLATLLLLVVRRTFSLPSWLEVPWRLLSPCTRILKITPAVFIIMSRAAWQAGMQSKLLVGVLTVAPNIGRS